MLYLGESVCRSWRERSYTYTAVTIIVRDSKERAWIPKARQHYTLSTELNGHWQSNYSNSIMLVINGQRIDRPEWFCTRRKSPKPWYSGRVAGASILKAPRTKVQEETRRCHAIHVSPPASSRPTGASKAASYVLSSRHRKSSWSFAVWWSYWFEEVPECGIDVDYRWQSLYPSQLHIFRVSSGTRTAESGQGV